MKLKTATKQNNTLKQTLIFVALVVMTYGCQKEADKNLFPSLTAPAAKTTAWSFSADVNGVLSNADSATAYLVIDSSLSFPLRVLVLDGYCQGKNIVPGFGDTINSATPTTLNYNNIAAGAMSQYYSSNDTINEFTEIAASFKITAVDAVNNKISGEFSGTLVGSVTGDTVVISNGTFTNIHYVVY